MRQAETVPLKRLFESITDGTHFSPSTVINEGMPYVTVRDVQSERVNIEGSARISLHDFRRLENEGCRPRVNDLLFSKDGTVGKVALCERDDFVVLSSLAILRPAKDYVPRYLKYVLLSGELLGQVEEQMAGAALRRITLDKIVALRAHTPPEYSDQERIANFLDEQTERIDALIAEKQELLDSLKKHQYSYASALMTKGQDAIAQLSETSHAELGAIPAHWSVKRLKFLGEVRSGIAKGKDHGGRDTVLMPYLRVANVQDGYVDLSNVLEIEVGIHEVERYLLCKGDVLMNEGGDNDKLGRGTVWKGQIDPCVHQNHVFSVRLFDTSLAEWVARFTSTDAARNYFFLRSKQSTNLASINQSNVRELPIPMPPEVEREAILAELQRASAANEELTTHVVQHLSLLREYRSSLISAAVTGQLDISTFDLADVS